MMVCSLVLGLRIDENLYCCFLSSLWDLCIAEVTPLCWIISFGLLLILLIIVAWWRRLFVTSNLRLKRSSFSMWWMLVLFDLKHNQRCVIPRVTIFVGLWQMGHAYILSCEWLLTCLCLWWWPLANDPVDVLLLACSVCFQVWHCTRVVIIDTPSGG